MFIVAALIGSMFLTQRAASDPLAGAWTGISDQLIELGDNISRYLPMGGNVRPLGNLSFGDLARISPRWVTDDKVAFTATVPKKFQDQPGGRRRSTRSSWAAGPGRRQRSRPCS